MKLWYTRDAIMGPASMLYAMSAFFMFNAMLASPSCE